ncbi:unnamed protein product, partial [Scytosiphon promiscuus]
IGGRSFAIVTSWTRKDRNSYLVHTSRRGRMPPKPLAPRPPGGGPRAPRPSGGRKTSGAPPGNTKASKKAEIMQKVTRNCIVNAVVKNKQMVLAR